MAANKNILPKNYEKREHALKAKKKGGFVVGVGGVGGAAQDSRR